MVYMMGGYGLTSGLLVWLYHTLILAILVLLVIYLSQKVSKNW